jgi:hypothetical protein
MVGSVNLPSHIMTPATVFEPRRTNYLKLETVPFYEFNPLYIGPSALLKLLC